MLQVLECRPPPFFFCSDGENNQDGLIQNVKQPRVPERLFYESPKGYTLSFAHQTKRFLAFRSRRQHPRPTSSKKTLVYRQSPSPPGRRDSALVAWVILTARGSEKNVGPRVRRSGDNLLDSGYMSWVGRLGQKGILAFKPRTGSIGRGTAWCFDIASKSLLGPIRFRLIEGPFAQGKN